MIITKVLNNNVILVEDDHETENIVLGVGIGFNSYEGQRYTLRDNDKVFSSLENVDEKFLKYIKSLSEEIPLEYFELSEKIVNIAKEQIGKKFNDRLLFSLTDHIFFSVERYRVDMTLANPMLFDIKRFFPNEYAVGKKAQQLINNLANISISDDEAGFIAIHLVEHEKSETTNDFKVSRFLKITSDVSEIIESALKKNISNDDASMQRLMTHLRFLMFHKDRNIKSSSQDGDLYILEKLMNEHKREQNCFNQIIEYLKTNVQLDLNDSEKLYLFIHVIHITE